MALIKCSECGKEISDSAEHCPHCGCQTNRGKTVTEAKGLLVNMAIVVVLMIVGLILFLTSLPELGDHSSYYWDSSRWMHDGETVWAIIKLVMGIGLFLGGIIDLWMIKDSADKLNETEAPVVSAKQTENTRTMDEIWICSNCGQQNLKTIKTCQSCGVTKQWSDARRK